MPEQPSAPPVGDEHYGQAMYNQDELFGFGKKKRDKSPMPQHGGQCISVVCVECLHDLLHTLTCTILF